jgi:hypothetical protein
LLIDPSKVSIKAVPLHKGKTFSSVPLAHAAKMKELYENMTLLLEKSSRKNINGTFVKI